MENDNGGKVPVSSQIQENESGTKYTIPGILHFIQHEWARFEMDRAHWDVEKAELQVKHNFISHFFESVECEWLPPNLPLVAWCFRSSIVAVFMGRKLLKPSFRSVTLANDLREVLLIYTLFWYNKKVFPKYSFNVLSPELNLRVIIFIYWVKSVVSLRCRVGNWARFHGEIV